MTAVRFGRQLSPSLLAVLAQILATVVYYAVGTMFFPSMAETPVFALFQGAIAAVIGWLTGLPPWWLPINLLFFPAVVFALELDGSPLVYFAGFLILLAAYWNAFRSRVPLYFSSNEAWQALVSLLPMERHVRFVDLGSGIGSVLNHLARRAPLHAYTGYETAPIPYWIARLRTVSAPNVELKWCNFWGVDLGGADYIYAYLSPAPMMQLRRKLQNEMREGATFISNTFTLPGVRPSGEIPLGDISGGVLYIYQRKDLLESDNHGAENC